MADTVEEYEKRLQWFNAYLVKHHEIPETLVNNTLNTVLAAQKHFTEAEYQAVCEFKKWWYSAETQQNIRATKCKIKTA
jgi:hypothetical protein